MRVFSKQSRSGHELAWLAVPTLGDIFGNPGSLQGMVASLRIHGETRFGYCDFDYWFF
jgi:hypothetical protein